MIMNKTLEIKIATSDKDYADAMRIRKVVFVQELGIPQEKEFDGNDHTSTHILALDGDKPVGTMRIRYFGNFVKFERMCVISAYRKSDASEQIMKEGMRFCAEKGYEKVYAVCKKELLNRWDKDGFKPIPNVDPIVQNGMTLISVYSDLPKVEKSLSMETPPGILNAREGEWFKEKPKKELSRVRKMLQNLKFAPDVKVKPIKAPYAHPDFLGGREN